MIDYSKFVTEKVKNFVVRRITPAKILDSSDFNYNNVPDFYWDELHLYIWNETRTLQLSAGMTPNLLENSTKIAKAACKIWWEEQMQQFVKEKD